MKDKTILFAFPFAGGSRYSFNPLREYFSNDIEFFPVELPGRGARIKEELVTGMDRLVQDIYEQIAAHLHEPYAFFGHSMGATIAYALTRKLVQQNDMLPLHLIVSGRGGPSSIMPKQTYRLPRAEFTASLIELGGIPGEVLASNALMEFFEPILRADFEALETYRYSPAGRFDIPVTVLVGKNDKTTVEEALQWQNETTIPINLHHFEGGHFFILDTPFTVVETIKNTLIQPEPNRQYR